MEITEFRLLRLRAELQINTPKTPQKTCRAPMFFTDSEPVTHSRSWTQEQVWEEGLGFFLRLLR